MRRFLKHQQDDDDDNDENDDAHSYQRPIQQSQEQDDDDGDDQRQQTQQQDDDEQDDTTQEQQRQKVRRDDDDDDDGDDGRQVPVTQQQDEDDDVVASNVQRGVQQTQDDDDDDKQAPLQNQQDDDDDGAIPSPPNDPPPEDDDDQEDGQTGAKSSDVNINLNINLEGLGNADLHNGGVMFSKKLLAQLFSGPGEHDPEEEEVPVNGVQHDHVETADSGDWTVVELKAQDANGGIIYMKAKLDSGADDNFMSWDMYEITGPPHLLIVPILGRERGLTFCRLGFHPLRRPRGTPNFHNRERRRNLTYWDGKVGLYSREKSPAIC